MPPENRTFLDACRGLRPAHRPIWIMRQAGRYLPEYRAVRAKVSFETLCRTPQLAAEVTAQPVERFDLDAAILFSDILTVLDVFGMEVRFDPGPKIDRPLRSGRDVADLAPQGIDRVDYVFEAVRACTRRLERRVPLIGFAGAPLTVASYMVEGGGSKDFRHTKLLAWTDPPAFEALLEQLVEVTAAYLAGQVRAGADAVQVFESWGGALPPEVYAERVLPHLRRLLDRTLPLGVPVIAFVRGGAALLREVAQEIPPEVVVGVDPQVGLDRAVAILGRDRVVQGNLDPVALLAPEPVMRAQADAVLAAGARARGHVFNLGHGIDKDTDPARVAALVAHVHRWPAAS